jgi:eukaryotic-like serine/threonine-protein kinase
METDSQMIGRLIDSYEITELIGRGGMGVVYKAKDVKLDRDVALKIMDPLLAREETFLKRFWSEAKALAKLQNPYIVAIYALRESEYGVCIVMEYVKGTTLGDFVKASGPLPIEMALRLFKQLLLAFEHAHGAGIIHRDVKPGNIMVTDNNVAKVMDFGLAKIYQPAVATLTSITGGTLFYASPEQLEGLGNVDHRGDIYSLGMTLYESLTGAVPFGNTESDFAIREKIVKGRIPSPRGMKPQIPAELNSIVMKAIAKDPENRYQTAAEMREALENFEVSFKQARTKKSTGARWTLNPRWLAVPAGLLLIVAAILLYPVLLPDGTTVTVRSIPVGATVEINGEVIGETPVRNHTVTGGQAVVRLRKSGFLRRDTTITVSKGEAYVLSLELQQENAQPPKTGALVVKTDPPSASVWVDGVPVKSMPYRTSPGEHFVRVVSGKLTWEGKATVVADGTVELPVELVKPVQGVPDEATVTIRSIPAGARVEINRRAAGQTPVRNHKVAPGHTVLKLRKEGYQPKDTSITVPQGGEYVLSLVLQKEKETPQKTGVLSVRATPSSASTWVDEAPVQSMPYRTSPGVHFVRVVSGKLIWEGRVSVAEGGSVEIPIDFTKQVRITVVAVDADGDPVKGAKILLDGVFAPKVAPTELVTTFGVHSIALQREGYEDSQPVVKCFEKDLVFPNPLKIVLKKSK